MAGPSQYVDPNEVKWMINRTAELRKLSVDDEEETYIGDWESVVPGKNGTILSIVCAAQGCEAKRGP